MPGRLDEPWTIPEADVLFCEEGLVCNGKHTRYREHESDGTIMMGVCHCAQLIDDVLEAGARARRVHLRLNDDRRAICIW
ncbi:MAG: hypothetical protein AUG49_15315 [Catenulispora sp. 13_1_20CM_3_70_7]|nr:MAG: hypothetical protein AUG49_15315 [Catenulispora sp. 13_1_20CM_3_70_7]